MGKVKGAKAQETTLEYSAEHGCVVDRGKIGYRGGAVVDVEEEKEWLGGCSWGCHNDDAVTLMTTLAIGLRNGVDADRSLRGLRRALMRSDWSFLLDEAVRCAREGKERLRRSRRLRDEDEGMFWWGRCGMGAPCYRIFISAQELRAGYELSTGAMHHG